MTKQLLFVLIFGCAAAFAHAEDAGTLATKPMAVFENAKAQECASCGKPLPYQEYKDYEPLYSRTTCRSCEAEKAKPAAPEKKRDDKKSGFSYGWNLVMNSGMRYIAGDYYDANFFASIPFMIILSPFALLAGLVAMVTGMSE